MSHRDAVEVNRKPSTGCIGALWIAAAVLSVATPGLDRLPGLLSLVACTTVVAGRRAAATGRVMVGHNEDDSGRPAVRHGYVPPRDFDAGSVMPAEADHAAVPQVPHTFGFYWSECKYVEKGGSSFCDSFFNENGVLLCSNSARAEGACDPVALVDGGIGYNLRRAVAERSTSARHAVDVLTGLVSHWGYASPGRLYTLADAEEAWVVQVVYGRERYVARRVPDDEVALIPNCYTVRSFLPGDVRAPSLENCGADFDFARSFQGESKWKAPVNQGRWRNLVRIFAGVEWPNDDYPFSVKPKAPVDSSLIRKALGTHYEGTPDEVPVGEDGTRHDESRFAPVCRRTTAESAVYTFGGTPRDMRVERCIGSPCLGSYETVYPLADPQVDPLVVERLERHTLPETTAFRLSPNYGKI